MYICQNCGVEFEARKPARTCSPKCRKELSRKGSVTRNVTLGPALVTDTFKFHVTYSRKSEDPGYDEVVKEQGKTVREAKYWYDVPLAAIPIYQKGWPTMPEGMNGRQYFLWWKNEFKESNGIPEIHNPFPVYSKVTVYQANEGSRRWGA